ncbi:MAG: Queuine/archaeosine tRNA-ribosyltransferase TGT [Candidatus Methanohalarchaeum thermophilum]|uniref:tRNA-guanine(15) transglycosylase n=1 Tax=Methanohalarchaeum thermophilum TaxID=1903181 RepID=A0A1Q6DUY0_METT1|nr:MAG: Queuine/archaeosine tRNA-ribosyltransferase TGT [Candidatus Methanohalarchaeum thermophilum]
MRFEIKRKDFGGRIGSLELGDWEIETPTIMPVVNPNLETVSIEDIRDVGADILITNSYIIYKNEKLRERVLKEGLHDFLGFDGPIMTDSGAYQLSVYGDVEVTSQEILNFQEEIGSDIGVPLDIPTSPDATRDKAEKDLAETMDRLRSIGEFDDLNVAGPVQGASYGDLRSKAANQVSEIGFDLYCIGGVVPIMESYDFEKLAQVVIPTKKNLPVNKPIHLFGAGHPMIFSFAVALGCDLFDSAAYALFAKRGKYITVRGTWDVGEMEYLPCSCPVCSNAGAEDLVDDKEKLAKHNLYVTFREINTVKESIRRGELFELVSERSRAHPSLLSGLMKALDEENWFEKFAPVSKKNAFFYCGEESLKRPELLRNLKKIDSFNLTGKRLLIVPHDFKINTDSSTQIIKIKPPFVYSEELSNTYPFGQSLIANINKEKRKKFAKRLIKKIIDKFGQNFEEIYSIGNQIELGQIKDLSPDEARKRFSI